MSFDPSVDTDEDSDPRELDIQTDGRDYEPWELMGDVPEEFADEPNTD